MGGLKTLVLGGAPYRMGPSELAKRLGLTPAAMTHRIDRLAGEGLVTRDRDETNRVRVIVELTDEGRAKWLEAMRMATAFEEGPAPGPLRRRAGRPGGAARPAAAPGRARAAGRRRAAHRPGRLNGLRRVLAAV